MNTPPMTEASSIRQVVDGRDDQTREHKLRKLEEACERDRESHIVRILKLILLKGKYEFMCK